MHPRRLALAVWLFVAAVAAVGAALMATAALATRADHRSPGALRASDTSHDSHLAAARWLFGDRTVEPGRIPDASGVARAFRAHDAVHGTTMSLVVFVAAHSTARSISVALYSSRLGHPTTLLAHGQLGSPRRGKWNVIALTPFVVRAGHDYWIAILPSGGRLDLRGRVGGCGNGQSKSHLTSLPATWIQGRPESDCRVSAFVRGRRIRPGNLPPTPSPGGSGPATRNTNCSPTAGGTMTNTVSHLCGFADTTNAGVPSGATLHPASTGPGADTGSGWAYRGGAIDTTTNGAIIKNVRCACGVNVTNTGVTIRDSDLEVSGVNSWAVALRHASNATIKHDNLHGPGTAADTGCDSAIRDIYSDSDNMTVENNNVWYCADPMNIIANGGLIEQNYFHDFVSSAPGDHYEDIQLEAGDGDLMTIQDNTFFNQNTQTAAIILSVDGGGTETNRVINHNLLAGGGYCFYGGSSYSGNPATNITFTNNHFSSLYYPRCGYYGAVAYWTSGNGNVWSGNIRDNNGASVGP